MDDVEALSVVADAAERDARMKEAEAEAEEEQGDGGGDRSEEVVRWETFLPRMVVRVLLVEADRSTRQIITALLRKCSYAVIPVSNGLKAWETLKKKATDLDLILTEVELPAISGYALLTLIMEHDICKNIPVIMMSSDDSISMVLKCMLKGATDFLIKPVRRNELRNLWQHVWRRHTISRSPQNTTFPQEKLKTAAQDNSVNNQSSGSVASLQKNNGFGEKLSEAQSTCTSSFLEAEGACVEKLQDESQLKSSLKLSNIDAVQHEESTKLESESTKHNDETGERSVALVSEAASCSKTLKPTDLRIEQDHCCAETESQYEVLRAELSRANSNVNAEIHGCSDAVVEPSGGAINLIAIFENLEKFTNENCSFSGYNTTKFDLDSKLEFSLRSDLPGSSSKQASEATEERQRLNHSKTSAFSWYSGNSKLLQPLFPTPVITSAKVTKTDWNSHESHKSSGNTLDTSCQYGGTSINQENMTTLVIGHGNVLTSVIYAQPSVNPVWNTKPVCQKESSPFPTSTSSHSNPGSHNSEEQRNAHDKSNLDHARHDSSSSSAADQSAGNSLCHDAANRIDGIAYESIGSGSDGNATSTVVAKNNPHDFSDSGHHNYDGFGGTNSHRSSQREAALTKFRLKRKERCYQKKVRYQSRKRLAEQRPRVKGQFVRQVHHDHPVADASGDS